MDEMKDRETAIWEFLLNFKNESAGAEFASFETCKTRLTQFSDPSNYEVLYLIEDSNSRTTIVNSLSDLAVENCQSIITVVKSRPDLPIDDIESNLITLRIPMISLNQSTDNSIEVLRSLVRTNIDSYFDLLYQSGRLSTIPETLISRVKQSVKDLLMSLQRMQHSVQIPQLLSSVSNEILLLVDNGRLNSKDNTAEINLLQSTVNSWVTKIGDIVDRTRQIQDGSISDEINFWLTREEIFKSLIDQLNSPEINKIIECLRKNKRSLSAITFLSGNHLAEHLTEANKNYNFLKDIPYSDIESSTDLNELQQSITSTFIQMKKLRTVSYPVSRAVELMELFTRDIRSKIILILKNSNYTSLDFKDFKIIEAKCSSILRNLEDQLRSFVSMAREQHRKRGDGFTALQMQGLKQFHDALSIFNETKYAFEEIAQQTKAFISFEENPKLSSSMRQLIEEDLENTRKKLDNVELEKAFSDVEKYNIMFNQCLIHIEKSLINGLKSIIESEMLDESYDLFETLETFSYLLSRPNVRISLSMYHAKLLSSIESALNEIELKMKNSTFLLESITSNGIPTNTARLVFVRYTMLSLSKVNVRLELILSPDWTKYPEGQKFSAKITRIISELNSNNIIDDWIDNLNEVISSSFINDNILSCSNEANVMTFKVNLCEGNETLLQECDCLKLLQFDDLKLINFQNVFKLEKLIPLAISLQNSIHNLNYCSQASELLGNMDILIKPLLTELLENFNLLLHRKWKELATDIQYKESGYAGQNIVPLIDQVGGIANFAIDCIKKVQILQLIKIKLFESLQSLATCAYDKSAITSALNDIQTILTTMLIGLYPNMETFIQSLNSSIKDILTSKLKSAITEFKTDWSSNNFPIIFDFEQHQILFHDSSYCISPPLEVSKEKFITIINGFCDVISNQNLMSMSLNNSNQVFVLEDSYLNQYEACLAMINVSLDKSNTFSQKWIELVSINCVDIEDDISKLSNDITEWMHFINEVKEKINEFDPLKTIERFGLINIDYSWAQSKIYNEFDLLMKNLLHKFSIILYQDTMKLLSEIENHKKTVLEISDQLSAPRKSLLYIAAIQRVSTKMEKLNSHVKENRGGHRILFQKKFKFPSNWVHFDQVQNEYDAANHILDINKDYIRGNYDLMVSIALDEKSNVINTVKKIKAKWDTAQLSAAVDVSDAMRSITDFENKLKSISERIENVLDSYKLLDLPLEVDGLVISNIVDHLQELKSTWVILMKFFDDINRMGNYNWFDTDIGTIKSTLNSLLLDSKSITSGAKNYPAFQKMVGYIKDSIRALPILIELKGDAIKPYHLNEIFMAISGHPCPDMVTMDNILQLQLTSHEKYVMNLITKAQSEKVINDSINKINDRWSTLSFDLLVFESNYTVIKSWDFLFQIISEDLNTLSSIKVSIHFDRFSKQILQLESKLDKLYTILDTWMEFQRKWVYLYGTFNGNDNVKHLMPIEVTRFDNMTLEMRSLMKSVLNNNIVFEVLNIPDIIVTLSRVSETLSRVRKALNVYIEKQREEFPRFYFIGNDDLLELIGNSKSLAIISKHIKKMFIGVSSLIYDHEAMLIRGVISADNESFILKDPVSLIKYHGLRETLVEFEKSIAHSLSQATVTASKTFQHLISQNFGDEKLVQFVNQEINQVSLLCLQIFMTTNIELAIRKNSFETLSNLTQQAFEILTKAIFKEMETQYRLKIENFIIELINYRDIISHMKSSPEISLSHPSWFFLQKFYLDSNLEPLKNLTVAQGNSKIIYGYEYLGINRKLAYTPLINQSFISMTEAIHQHLGSMLAGPAGTGKTESIKALGYNLGKMVFVFCCDDSFDYQSVCRILVGISCVGAWCCFDEFNRLEGNMLSAMSTQIEEIESSLSNISSSKATVMGKTINVSKDTGIFLTNNPKYEGRTTLPDNLKNKYITFTMSHPDSQVIADVMFSTQGFSSGKKLSGKIVSIYEELSQKCSTQVHYDFGLRSIKSVLVTAGKLKRNLLKTGLIVSESDIFIQSLLTVILPQLIEKDKMVFKNVISVISPNFSPFETNTELSYSLKNVSRKQKIECSTQWVEKCHQVYEIQQIHTGVMLVGDAGSGKSTLFNLLIEAIKDMTKKDNLIYTIDPKVVGKESLFGTMDYTTREWSDGIFTSIIRRSIESAKNESRKNIWIILDGDIDPQWVENLNSVLDDNKCLTLPNGERLEVPSNVKLIFEVDNLIHSTPATVSRCGIVWFEENMVSSYEYFKLQMAKFEDKRVGDEEIYNDQFLSMGTTVDDFRNTLLLNVQQMMTEKLIASIECISKKYHDELDSVVRFKWNAFFSLLEDSLVTLLDFNIKNRFAAHDDYSLYFSRIILLSIFWSFAGGFCHSDRINFETDIRQITTFTALMEELSAPLMYSTVSCSSCKWVDQKEKVAVVDIDPHMVTDPDLVIPTIDTITYKDTIFQFLNQHTPLILCGPPGAGKTMLLLSALRKSNIFSLVSLNFSKDTTPDLIIRSLEHNCTYKMSSSGLTMHPPVIDKWLVLFCDELNLPKADKYDSQLVISFLRGLVVHNGFWHPKKKEWITLKNIQLVGACNPPDLNTRMALSKRFQNNCAIMMVDYPGKESLKQIYDTFSKGVLRCVPDLIGYTDSLTNAMIDVYTRYHKHFNSTDKPHYICSPRELTRWIRGIFKGLKPLTNLNLEGLVRLWAHEGLRLFSDKLATSSDRDKMFSIIKDVTNNTFPYIDESKALSQPILYSDWLSYDYESIEKSDLSKFIKQKLQIFSEEEFNTNAVLYEDLLEHSLRIDRVLKSVQGHMMLVGESGSGKTTLVKFVSWMNGIKTYQLNVSNDYTIDDFDNTLKSLLIRTTVKNERICFIIDESTILDAAFLERMNTLLANAEVPGLFEGEELKSLMSSCSKASKDEGLLLENDEELYSWFRSQIVNNFHVIFTMSDPYQKDSPLFIQSNALFNRCVINWMGNWSQKSLMEVSSQVLKQLPIDKFDAESSTDLRSSIISLFISVHTMASSIGLELCQSPMKFLDMLHLFVDMYIEKETELQMRKNHTNIGLDKMKATVLKVKRLNQTLTQKKAELITKEKEARLVLDKMIMDQNESERKQDLSLQMKKLFAEQEIKIEKKRDSVKLELQEVEPLIYEAQQGVSNIKKQHLTEMRSMMNPPETIKMVLESVCVLLGYPVNSWKDVQQVVRQDDFIANIVNYDSEVQLNQEMIQFMETRYLNKDNYTYESANRASKALGPLMMWVKAQLRYASIITQVEPLRRELRKLEIELIDSKSKLIAVEEMINDLQSEIEHYKTKYSEHIRDVESIKIEMNLVETKVLRSVKLLDSLKTERIRWKSNIEEFDRENESFIGDIIISSVFSVYCGDLVESKRIEFLKHLMICLNDYGIKFDEKFDIITKLTRPNMILEWQNAGLSNDNQFIQNVSLMKSSYSKRYSILVDPTGQMIEFLENSMPSIVVTSFLDSGYVQKLENCIKFGGTILIKNGEFYDPILNRLISNDVTLIGGGRRLVEIGSKEIDFDPRFKLFIHTKDSTIRLLPFLKSRVNLLNFSFTNNTVLNEGLNLALKSERPEVESQRLELLKTRDQYKSALTKFEEDLLRAINESKDDILENDDLAHHLETIKVKSNETILKSKEVETVIETFHNIISDFKPLGNLYVDLTNLVNSLWKINVNYKFSKDFTKLILIDTLNKFKGYPINELKKNLVEKVYYQLSTILLKNDLVTIKQTLNIIGKNHLIKDAIFSDCSIEESIIGNKFNLMRSSSVGYDPSILIQQLAPTTVVKYSMGQLDGSAMAFEHITQAIKLNQWVIIENIELSIEFITKLPNFLEETNIDSEQFKLFMTSQLDCNLPTLVIESCNQIIIESSTNIKSILDNHLLNKSFNYNIIQELKPKQLKVVYFGMLWVFAMVMSNLKLVPLTLHDKYDLNESDLIVSLKFIKSIVESQMVKGEFYEDMVPFDCLKQMVGAIIFGGKIDDLDDRLKIEGIVNETFDPRLFDGGMAIKNLKLPNNLYDVNQVRIWIEQLPDLDPLSWFGLTEDVRLDLNEKKKTNAALDIKKLGY